VRRAGRSRAVAPPTNAQAVIRARQRAARRALSALLGRCEGVGSLCPPEVPSASLRAMADDLRAMPADPRNSDGFAIAQEQLARYCEWMAEVAEPNERTLSAVLIDLAESVRETARLGASRARARLASQAIATQLVGIAGALQSEGEGQ